MNSKQFRWKLSPILVVLFFSLVNAALAQQRSTGQGTYDDAAYDHIVDQFIQYDIGAIRDPVAIEQIRARFNGLRADDAVPALVRGLNMSTRMRASCPITALTGKLKTILNNTYNPEVGTYVLGNLERREVGSYNGHVKSVFTAAENAVLRVKGKEIATQQFKRRFESDSQRLAYVPGLKFTDLSAREPDGSSPSASEESTSGHTAGESRPSKSTPPPTTVPPSDLRKLSGSELAERLNDRASQAKVLEEFYRRASGNDSQAVAEHAQQIAKVLKDGDDAARESAARLLGLVRSDKAIPQLIEAIEDGNTKVRSAASTALARITRQLFGPSDNASPEETKLAVVRWRDWWNRQQKTR